MRFVRGGIEVELASKTNILVIADLTVRNKRDTIYTSGLINSKGSITKATVASRLVVAYIAARNEVVANTTGWIRNWVVVCDASGTYRLTGAFNAICNKVGAWKTHCLIGGHNVATSTCNTTRITGAGHTVKDYN